MRVRMTARARVIVAMSGGVDSAVAAARLVDQGHDVVGVTLHLWDYPEEDGARSHGRCCAPEDQYDARRTADALGIPHFTFDRRELFARTVVEPFVEAYLAGETPSPCTACNRGVKISELVALADRLGAARVILVLRRAAPAMRTGGAVLRVVPEVKRDADDVVSFVDEPRSGNGGVDPAAHGHDDALARGHALRLAHH